MVDTQLEIVGDQRPQKARIEGKHGLRRQSGPAFRDVLEPEQPALQRMHLLDLHHGRELHQHLDEAHQRNFGHDRAPQQRLDVLRRVVDRPRFLIDRLQLFPRHFRMVGDGVLEE
jgi:hypothetical protein